MSRTSPPACRNCGKVPAPDLPHGLCARCLMVRLLDHPLAAESGTANTYVPPRRLSGRGPNLPIQADEVNPLREPLTPPGQ